MSRAQLWAQMGSPRSGHGNAPRRKENSPANGGTRRVPRGRPSSGPPLPESGVPQMGKRPPDTLLLWHRFGAKDCVRLRHRLRGCSDHVVTMNTGALRFLGTKGALFTWLPSWIQTSNSCQPHRRDPGHCAASDDGMLRKTSTGGPGTGAQTPETFSGVQGKSSPDHGKYPNTPARTPKKKQRLPKTVVPTGRLLAAGERKLEKNHDEVIDTSS